MRYQIVTLRVPFEDWAIDGPPEEVPSEWNWSGLCDRAGTVVLDCDPVSENPDVQPIERLPAVDDVWGEHPLYSRSSWQHEVANGDSNQGYWEWCELQSQDANDEPAWSGVEIRADKIGAGDLIDDAIRVGEVTMHGDTVLITGTEGQERAIDMDVVVTRVIE